MLQAGLRQKVLITGASRGLGECLARTFWLAGHDLLLVSRSVDALHALSEELATKAADGQSVHFVDADLALEGAVARIIAHARSLWDHLDVVVNNAAIIGPIGPAWENEWAHWVHAIRVNLLAPVELSRAAACWMVPNRSGCIINISGGGATSPRPHFSAYATAKAGLVRFSETLAQELLPSNIQVNCIAPGAMNTRMHADVLQTGAELVGEREWAIAQRQLQTGGTPMERPAELCLFLSSPQGKRITGRLISAIWDDWKNLPEFADMLESSDIYTLRRIIPEDRGMKW